MAEPPHQSLQELQDDLDLFTVLLHSAEEQPGDDLEVDKEYYRTRLIAIQDELDKRNNMGNTWSFQGVDQPRPSSSASNATVPTPNSKASRAQPSAEYLSLPSRKRERGEYDDDLDTRDLHRVKSRRSTPADSPPLSADDSISSDYFNDDLIDLLGDDWQRDARSNRDFLRRQEARKRQEEEDERYARELQEQWSNTPGFSFQSHSARPALPPAQRTQATFLPNGSFSATPAPQLRQEQARGKPEPADDGVSTPVSLSSSDDYLEMVDGSDYNQRFPTNTGSSRVLPSSFGQSSRRANIPGAYPSGVSTYSSMPGSSVYGAPTQPQRTPSLFAGLPSLPSLASVPGLGSMHGTQGMPWDLDTLASNLFGRSNDPRYGWEEVDPKETQEEIRQLLHNIRPDEEIDISEAGEDQPEALKARLMPHQVKGFAWMKKMEDSSNKGGLLADDMGLGKTIQAIALILARPPTGKVKKPTLIVTPVALMEQWKREILKMVRARAQLTVYIMHLDKATKSWDQVKHYDVILISFATLAGHLNKRLKWVEKMNLNSTIRREKKDEHACLDDNAKFHRIILDEAHNIKNKNTKAAIAACRVQAEFRWCLSGTPMQNNVEEIYSLIKFLRIRPYNSAEKFGRDISRPLKARHGDGPKRAMEKLQAVLKAIMLRRTKTSTIDGKPILQLPEKHTVQTRAIFDKDQLEFYRALETSSRIQFNKYVKNGTVGHNYSKALVLLLRLRQACCSPQLVTNSADFITDAGIEGLDMVANARDLPDQVVARIKEMEDMECPICMDAVDNPTIFNPCGHTICQDCFARMVDSVTIENADVKCPHCRAKIDTRKITDHASFKEVHEGGTGASEVPAEEDEEETDSESGASDDSFWDDDKGEDLKDFIVSDDAPPLDGEDEGDDSDEDEDDLDRVKKPAKTSQLLPKPAKKGKLKRRDTKGKKKEKKETKSLAELRKEGLKNAKAKRKYLRQLAKIYEPCAKVDKTLELLNDIYNRGENEKTIVFSSFTSFLDLLEVPLSQDVNLSKYTRYDGSMTAKERNAAVLEFTDKPDCRVILVSLKAGNAGLNLTIANHVLILDPFWNPFVEYQAADRCHRIGQKREVTVHRVLIGEEGVDHEAKPEHVFTVEDRILALQEKKKKLVENALDENGASGIGRLGVRELGYLFGVDDMPSVNGT